MSTVESQPASQPGPHWQPPALATEDRLVAGVAAGMAHEVGVDPLVVRLGFVTLFAAGGWGALLYIVVWGGLAQLEYSGRGPKHPPRVKGRTPAARLAGVGLLVAGSTVFLSSLPGLGSAIVWPVGLAVAGMVVLWRQAMHRQSTDDRRSIPQLVVGSLSLVTGVVYLFEGAFGLGSGAASTWLGVAVALGLIAVAAPWWWRMVENLDKERQARARSDERAEVAAHIHDSVLQTLTLIQKHGEDPTTMRNLARRQERELRNWLDPDRTDRTGLSIRGHLDAMATEIEDLHGVPLEVVVVGDCLVDDAVGAALAAAREAVVNAAKHSGADQIDLFVEVGAEIVEIFVRDTGCGFDPSSVAGDRRGLSESIDGRMTRAGGSASVHSQLGEGTEVELRVPRLAINDQPQGSTQ